MVHTRNLLLIAALLPAFVLCIYVYIKDRSEKEPIGLLLLLLLAGAFTCFPAAYIEGIVNGLFREFFSVTKEANGSELVPENVYYTYHFIKMFIGVALVEEGVKYVALALLTKNSKNFNSLFDGLIYSVFVSLGFAAFENVLYVLNNGWYVAIMRAVTAVPAHMFFAVLMGYNYSFARVTDEAGRFEESYIASGAINSNVRRFSSKSYRMNTLLIPVLAHGLYDFACTGRSIVLFFLFVAFVIYLYIHCFRKIKTLSASDMPVSCFAWNLIYRKYPHIYDAHLREYQERMKNTQSV